MASRWQKQPEFQKAYRDARRAAFGQSISRLHQMSSAAVATLGKVMVDPGTPPSTGYHRPRSQSNRDRRYRDARLGAREGCGGVEAGSLNMGARSLKRRLKRLERWFVPEHPRRVFVIQPVNIRVEVIDSYVFTPNKLQLYRSALGER